MNFIKPADATEPGKHARSPYWLQGGQQPKITADEIALAIFQPDMLISQQFLASYRRTYPLDPERTLMLAILDDAVTCFQTHLTATCKRKRTLFLDAEEWILATDSSFLYSFENVCETLGFDPAYLREGLMRWKETVLDTPQALPSNRRRAG